MKCLMIRIGSIAFLRPLYSSRYLMSKVHYVHMSWRSNTLCIPCPLGDNDSMAILMEDKCGINESTDHCVYYANLHHMVPVDQPDIEVSGSKDAGGDSMLHYVQVHKAHLVTLTKVDYKALHSRFAWLPANIVQKTF